MDKRRFVAMHVDVLGEQETRRGSFSFCGDNRWLGRLQFWLLNLWFVVTMKRDKTESLFLLPTKGRTLVAYINYLVYRFQPFACTQIPTLCLYADSFPPWDFKSWENHTSESDINNVLLSPNIYCIIYPRGLV